MNQEHPSELPLELPAGDAIRLLLSDTLREAAGLVERLGDPLDDEAVHDFRVAVRRLRTFLRAFGECVSVDDRVQADLRDLTGLTNVTRDDEAHVEWLRSRLESGELEPEERTAVTGLLARLEGRVSRPSDLRAEARLVLDRSGRALVECGDAIEGRAANTGREVQLTFGQVTGAVMDHETGRLRRRLGRITTLQDARRIHRARLSEKRLRYVLEPVADQAAGTAGPLERLKGLQDTLGELHDLAGLGERLSGADSAIEAVVRRRREVLFETLAAEWLGGHADPFFADIAGITRDLRKDAHALRKETHSLRKEPS